MSNNAEALEDLKRALDLVVERLTGDLTRARGVVREAVAHLMVSFRGLEGAVTTQKQILDSISFALNESADATGNGLKGTTSRMLRDFIEQVVRVSGTSMLIIEYLMNLSEHIDMISKDSSTIAQLARESRFIAFNARIETQRAGEDGVSFKVVADEIKRLAGASGTLSAHIREAVTQSLGCLALIRKSANDLASHDMNAALESRTGLFDALARLDAVNSTFDAMLGKVTRLVADATRALQFEDMLTQLIDGTLRKTHDLRLLIRRAFDGLNSVPNGPGVADVQAVSRLLVELAQPGAVAQINMNQGEIELF